MNQRARRILLAATLLLLCVVASPSAAQQLMTTQYVYDENGRLRAVIAPDGQAAVYDYDPAGNITAIRRLTPESYELLTFSPTVGKWGDMVTFRGFGLQTVTAVSFNGMAARIIRSEPTRLIAEVPQGATTGPVTLASPRGLLTTPLPFTVRGVTVSPPTVSLNAGQIRQFTARVLPDESDQAVIWSVNDVLGGNSDVGTITTAGEYTAPRALFSMITVRATSVADPDLSGDALVMVGIVEDPALRTGFAAAYLLVGREQPTPPTPIAAIGAGVSVGRESITPPLPLAALSFVSVGREPNPPPTNATALSVGVSVGREQSVPLVPVAAISVAVSASKAPMITGATPSILSRGASNVTLTIRGANLNGASAIRFINAAGAADASLNATNLILSADGARLTATLNVNANAGPGRRLIVVTTPGGNSQVYQTGQNTIEVTP